MKTKIPLSNLYAYSFFSPLLLFFILLVLSSACLVSSIVHDVQEPNPLVEETKVTYAFGASYAPISMFIYSQDLWQLAPTLESLVLVHRHLSNVQELQFPINSSITYRTTSKNTGLDIKMSSGIFWKKAKPIQLDMRKLKSSESKEHHVSGVLNQTYIGRITGIYYELWLNEQHSPDRNPRWLLLPSIGYYYKVIHHHPRLGHSGKLGFRGRFFSVSYHPNVSFVLTKPNNSVYFPVSITFGIVYGWRVQQGIIQMTAALMYHHLFGPKLVLGYHFCFEKRHE
jgi:hypothetical protein